MSLTKQDLADIREVVIDAVNQSFEELSVPRFEALEERMDSLESRMDGLENRMGSIEGRMSAQESAQHETNRRLTAIETRLDHVESELVTIKNDIMALYELAGNTLPALDKEFDKLSNEDKVRALHSYTLALARQLDVQL